MVAFKILCQFISYKVGRRTDIGPFGVGRGKLRAFCFDGSPESRSPGPTDCIDGLTGLPEAIETIFSEMEVALCIVYQIRNSLRGMPVKTPKDLMVDLKRVYKAVKQGSSRNCVDELEKIWGEKGLSE